MFTCLESNREIKSVVYDPTGEAMSHGDIVYMLNTLQAEVYQLRANVGAGDTAISQLEQGVTALEGELQQYKDWLVEARHEAEQSAVERNDARQAARWMLPLLVNDLYHLREACRRWPWLEDAV